MENLEILAHDLIEMKGEVVTAQSTADKALMQSANHEAICAERYRNINAHLADIPLIFVELGKIKNLVYIGVGIWLGAPVVGGALFGIVQLMRSFAHGG